MQNSLVKFSPPIEFIQIKTISSMEFNDLTLEVESVHSIGQTFYYRLDDALKTLLGARLPDFTD